MNNTIEKDLEKYYHDVSKALACSTKKKQNIISCLKKGVQSYLADNPNATIEEIIEYLGKPNDIADEYYSNETGKEITKNIKTGRKILFCVVVSLVLALVVYIMAISIMVISDVQGSNGHYDTPVFNEVSRTDL